MKAYRGGFVDIDNLRKGKLVSGSSVESLKQIIANDQSPHDIEYSGQLLWVTNDTNNARKVMESRLLAKFVLDGEFRTKFLRGKIVPIISEHDIKPEDTYLVENQELLPLTNGDKGAREMIAIKSKVDKKNVLILDEGKLAMIKERLFGDIVSGIMIDQDWIGGILQRIEDLPGLQLSEQDLIDSSANTFEVLQKIQTELSRLNVSPREIEDHFAEGYYSFLKYIQRPEDKEYQVYNKESYEDYLSFVNWEFSDLGLVEPQEDSTHSTERRSFLGRIGLRK